MKDVQVDQSLFYLAKEYTNNSITLSENNDIVNDPKKVSEIFNDFNINVANNIGNPNTVIDKNHPKYTSYKDLLQIQTL